MKRDVSNVSIRGQSDVSNWWFPLQTCPQWGFSVWFCRKETSQLIVMWEWTKTSLFGRFLMEIITSTFHWNVWDVSFKNYFHSGRNSILVKNLEKKIAISIACILTQEAINKFRFNEDIAVCKISRIKKFNLVIELRRTNVNA